MTEESVRLTCDEAHKRCEDGAYSEAERLLREGLKQHPDDPELNARLGIVLCLTLRETTAVGFLGKARGADSFHRLGQMLVDHFHCRCLMAQKLAKPDPRATALLNDCRAATGLEPGDDVGITLSACLIAKDEEDDLDRCLSSLSGLADEIVLVDTGSTDDTVEIARSYGAKIGHYEWDDDFSAPRNESIRLATGHWILVLDADEEIDAEAVPRIREAIVRPQYGGYFLKFHNYMSENHQADVVVHQAPRLVRRIPGVEFRYRVHEQVLPSILEAGLPVSHISGTSINHYGYAPEIMEAKGKSERMIRMLEQAVEDYPEDPFQWFNLATAYSTLERRADVVRAARKAAELSAASARRNFALLAPNYQLLASNLTDLDRAEEALEACDEAVQRGVDCILTEFERARALLQLGRLQDALGAIDHCLELQWPETLTGNYAVYTYERHYLKARILAVLRRFDQALPLLRQVLSVNPGNPRGLFWLGITLYESGRSLEALEALQPVYDDPTRGTAAKAIGGRILAELQRFDEAQALLEAHWAEGGRDQDGIAAWAETCEGTGESQKLLPVFKELAAGGEMSLRVLMYWGRALQAAGDNEGALRVFGRAIQVAPNDPGPYFNCSHLMFQMGHYKEAAEVCQKALGMQQENAEGWVLMGHCLYRLNSLQGARISFEQAVRIAPGDRRAAELLEQVKLEMAHIAA